MRPARSRSSARRLIAGSTASAPTSARSAGASARPGSSSCRRPRRRTPPFPTTSGFAQFRTLAAWLEPVERQAVRALVIDAERRVLLVRFEHPVTHDSWWAATGGGVEPGESDHEALRRELHEEAGLHEFDVGAARPYARAHVPLGPPHHRAAGAVLSRPRRTGTTPCRRSTWRRRASPRFGGGSSRSSTRRPSGSFRPSSPRSCVVWRRDRGPRHGASARRRHLVRRLDGTRLRRRAGDQNARGRAARPGDEGARPALAAARLWRAARRGADRRRARLAGLAAQHRVPGRPLDEGGAFRLPARRLVPAQLRARPAPAGRDPRRRRAAHAAARSSWSAG